MSDVDARLAFVRAPFAHLVADPEGKTRGRGSSSSGGKDGSNEINDGRLTIRDLSASIASTRARLDEALDGNTHTELDQLALRFVTVLLGKSGKSGTGSGTVKVGKVSNEANKNLESAETILRLAEMTIKQLVTSTSGQTRCERKQCHEYLRFMRNMLVTEQAKPCSVLSGGIVSLSGRKKSIGLTNE